MSLRLRYLVIVILILFLGSWLYRQQNRAALAGPIKIGGLSALTGVGVAIGEEEQKGMLLAVEEINARGGIGGRPLELISEDISLDKLKVGVSVVQKLISVDKVVAIVGPQWDEPAFPILPLIEEAKVPMVGPDSSPMLEADRDYQYFFSTWYDNRVGIRELLRFAQAKNIKTVAIVKPVAAGFWEYTARIFTEEAPSYGVTVIDEIGLGNPLTLDFRTSLLRVKGKNPDAIFIVSSDYNQCVFLKQAEQIGFTGITLGTESSGDPTSLAQCSGLLEKRFFSTPVQADQYKVFAEQFKKRFGEYPKFPSSATAYDAVMVVAAGLEKSRGRGGEALRQAIAKLEIKGAALAELSFNSMGFANTPEDTFEINTVKNGQFVKVDY